MTKYALVPLEELINLKEKEIIYDILCVDYTTEDIEKSIVHITEEDISFEYEIIEK